MNFIARPYQRQIIDFIVQHPRCAIWAGMGMGKSAATLTALDTLFMLGDAPPALIIAPLRVAQSVWPDEVQKWATLRHLKVTNIHGEERIKKRLLRSKADIFTINYEQLPWLVNYLGDDWPFKIVVADESTKLKSYRTRQGSIRAQALSKVAHTKVERFIELTGTCAPKGVQDLWGQMHFLDRGQRLGKSFSAFTDRWFKPDWSGFGIVPITGAQQEIEDKLRDICLTIKSEDYFDLKKPIKNVIKIELPPKAMKHYKEVEIALFTELSSGEEIEVFNAAARTMKLTQFCLAEGTEVLTKSGWKKIETISSDDLLWDGVEWINCSGIVCNGLREVVELDGVHMTPDHLILTINGWQTAERIINANADGRFNRKKVRLPNRYKTSWEKQGEKHPMASPMYLWKRNCPDRIKFKKQKSTYTKILRMQKGRKPYPITWKPRDVWDKTIQYLGKRKISMQQSKRQRFQKLWRERDKNVSRMGIFFFNFLERYARWIFCGINVRSEEQQFGVLQKQLSMGNDFRTEQQYSSEPNNTNATWRDDNYSSGQSIRDKTRYDARTSETLRMVRSQIIPTTKKVYDIVNAGSRNRFVIRGRNGDKLISHNCNGAVYTDDEGNWTEVHDAKIQALQDIIEEAAGAAILVAYHFKSDLARLLATFKQGKVLDKNPQTIKDWNDGKIPLLFAHPASAGHGLSLQHGGYTLVFFGLDWNLENHLQIIERIGPVRQLQSGYNRNVFLHYLVGENTIDERILEVLDGKASVQEALLNAMKRNKDEREQ